MIKKTTVNLSTEEMQKLKALSFILDKSMTDLIRMGLQSLYDSLPKDQSNALKALATAKSGISEGKTKKADLQKDTAKRRT